MIDQKRNFKVIFTDGSRKEFTGDDVTLIYAKSLYYILGLKKNFKVEVIIDEARAKIYNDFDWDLSFSEKDMDYLITGPKTYTALDMEDAVVRYAKALGLSVEQALTWSEKQMF